MSFGAPSKASPTAEGRALSVSALTTGSRPASTLQPETELQKLKRYNLGLSGLGV